METVTDFILLGSKITADGDYSHELHKGCLLLGRKAMTNLESILKGTTTRDITKEDKKQKAIKGKGGKMNKLM